MFNRLKKIFPGAKRADGAAAANAPLEGGAIQIDKANQSAVYRKQGNEYLAQGAFENAAESYRQAIAINPSHAEAYVNLGYVLKEQKLYEEAERVLIQAIPLNPATEDAYYLLALVSQEMGKLDEAIDNYSKAIELKPDFEFAYPNLALALFQRGQDTDAKAVLLKAIALYSTNANFHYLLGKLYVHEELPDKAIHYFRKALSIQPELAEWHNDLGLALQAEGKLEEAIASYRSAIAVNPDFAVAHNNLASALQAQDELAEAIEHLKIAIARAPRYAEAHNNLGLALRIQGDLAAALDCCNASLAINPDFAEAHSNLGDVLSSLGKLPEAVERYQRALTLKPNLEMAQNNLGNAYKAQGQFELAVRQYQQAILLKPDFAMAHLNLGLVLVEMGMPGKAIKCFKDAIILEPNYVEAHLNLGLSQLLVGNFAQGWAEYEWRLRHVDGREYRTDPRDPTRLLPRPSTLLPLNLSGKKIGLLADQGIGDEIFFLRFAAKFHNCGASVSYLPSEKLATILSRCTDIDAILKPKNLSTDMDYWFSVGDAPLVLNMSDASDIPPPLRLSPMPERLEEMSAKLRGLGAGPYLGVTWRAGMQRNRGSQKSLFKEVPLEELAQALRVWPGQVLILQRLPEDGEVARFQSLLGREVADFSGLNENLESMLALLALLDEYVGVSNTNMHLRAGLGKGSAVLVAHPPDWRWMHAGEQSPWFPGFRLFRQSKDNEWRGALEGLIQYLNTNRKEFS